MIALQGVRSRPASHARHQAALFLTCTFFQFLPAPLHQAANPSTLRFCNLNQRGMVLHHVTHGRWHAEFHFVNGVTEKDYRNYVGAGAAVGTLLVAGICMLWAILSTRPQHARHSKSHLLQHCLRASISTCSLQCGAGPARHAAQGVPPPGEAIALLCSWETVPVHHATAIFCLENEASSLKATSHTARATPYSRRRSTRRSPSASSPSAPPSCACCAAHAASTSSHSGAPAGAADASIWWQHAHQVREVAVHGQHTEV